MDEFQKQLAAAQALLSEKHSFLLTTHLNPDGDALGSELALARFLSSIGRDVIIINHDATPSMYTFLDPAGHIRQYESTRDNALIARVDVICIIDGNQLGRVGSLEPHVRASRAKKICIDHHLDPEPFADIYLFDDRAASAGQIVYQLIRSVHRGSLPKAIAEPLYVAIMTDTGSFRFPKTDGDLHRIVADLIDGGADPVTLYQSVYERQTPNRLLLLGRILSQLQTAHNGTVALLTVTRKMFEETNTIEADTDNFINHTLTIAGVQIGLMVTELEGFVKISFRSKGDISINELAKEFGGNGHKNAAGARVANATIDEIVPEILARAEHYIIQQASKQ
ncbi:MAG: bifunctional oligoribonuclease/PAP phosphatase NrnA [Ignavibacteria bacterium]|nr:bifunctional oligoribonuclease/PAP phosphatase NrnA [Ignavibacteria bacterium]